MRSNSEIIDILDELRSSQGLSLNELSRRVGMAKSALSRYFNKTREFPINRVNSFAKALHSTPAYILGFEENNDLLNRITQETKKLAPNNQKKVLEFIEFQIDLQNKES